MTVKYSCKGLIEVGPVIEKDEDDERAVSMIKQTFIVNQGRKANLKKYQSTRRILVTYEVTVIKSRWKSRDYYLREIQGWFEKEMKKLNCTYLGEYCKMPYVPNISIRLV